MSTVKFTKQERIDAYKRVKEDLLDSGRPFSICNSLHIDVIYSFNKISFIFSDFPEMREYKQKYFSEKEYEQLWWNRTHRKPRLEALDEMIEMAENSDS